MADPAFTAFTVGGQDAKKKKFFHLSSDAWFIRLLVRPPMYLQKVVSIDMASFQKEPFLNTQKSITA